MTTTNSKSNTTGAPVQETAATTSSSTTSTNSTQQAAYYMHNDMKFALAPTTPPPAADLPFTFTHVAHDGTKTSTTFDPNSKPSAPKWAKKESVAPRPAAKEKDDGEKTLVLKKRGGGRGGRGRGKV